MKIGFYLQNKGIPGLDCSEPLKGNPGIGGTEYLFSAIPYALICENTCGKHEVVVISDIKCRLSDDLPYIVIEDSLSETLDKENVDCLVIRYSLDNYRLVKTLAHDVKIVMWAHNFIRRDELSDLSRDVSIAAIVCVGNEQLNFYRDHQAYDKSVVIFNGYPVNHFINELSGSVTEFNKRAHEVTYLGSIVDYKGFHLIAKAWKSIVAQVPDAHLNVIGGGKLYDRTQKLGRWGIAESSYEEQFMPYLLDDDGKLLESVTFHGVMGNEKSEVLNKTKVGVPNPSGVSETFCIAALELQLWGAVVTTINYGGLKDTVFSTGLLYNDTEKLAGAVVELLHAKDNKYNDLLNYAVRFDFTRVAGDWLTLFDAIESNRPLSKVLKPIEWSGHRLTEINRRIKNVLPFGRFLPTTMFYRGIFNRLKSYFKRWM